LVHTNGFGALFHSLIHLRMSVSSLVTLRWAERRSLPVQESAPWRESAARHNLATVFVAAPSTTDEGLRELTAAGTGFVYASSLMGVTGVRESVSTAARSLVKRIRAVTELPVCVGIGISNAAQPAQAADFADGVIVASALVKAVLDAPEAAAGTAAVAELTAELSRATRSS
jgi:tryptophan synthase alpha chain